MSEVWDALSRCGSLDMRRFIASKAKCQRLGPGVIDPGSNVLPVLALQARLPDFIVNAKSEHTRFPNWHFNPLFMNL